LVKTSVTEKGLANLELGQILNVSIQSINETLQGEVSYISTVIDPETKLFPIEVRLTSPSKKARPGMVADLVMTKNTGNDKGILIPSDALLFMNQEHYVFVIDENLRAEQRPVSVSQENDEWIQIQEGLKEGEKVVVKGHLTLK